MQKKTCSGSVSVQVLQRALKSFGVRLLLTSDPELQGPDAAHAWGYLVLCGGQWSAMRHVGEQELWVDLDSTLLKPQFMSAADILRLQVGMPPKSGCLVFAVLGSVPQSPEKAGRRVTRLSVHPRSICKTRFNL